MPLVKKKLSIAAGATSDQVLAGTTYEYVDPGTRIVVASAVDTAGTATADTTMDFTVNNAEFAKNASVSALVTGEPFGWNGNYGRYIRIRHYATYKTAYAHLSRFAPAAMIFIPCQDGLSHCPEEFTSADSIARGAAVLVRSVLALAEQSVPKGLI